MKGYKKALVASLATIGVSCALIGGATFALFTSDSTTDIAVTSGKVNVTASVGAITLYSYVEQPDGSYAQEEMQNGAFALGGTAEYDDSNNKLTINNIVPGDKVKFNVVINNYSSVVVKYQLTVDHDGDDKLFDALVVTGFGEDFVNDINTGKKITKWKTMETSETSVNLPVSIELPYTYNDEIVNGDESTTTQGKTCGLSIAVVAVQGNAATQNLDYVTNGEELIAAASEGNNQIILGADIDDLGEPVVFEGSSELILNGYSIDGQVINNGTLTVSGSAVGTENYSAKSRAVANASGATIYSDNSHTILNNGTLLIEGDVTVLCNGGGSYSAVYNAGTATILGGTYQYKEGTIVNGSSWYVIYNAPNATITELSGVTVKGGSQATLINTHGTIEEIKSGVYENTVDVLKLELSGVIGKISGGTFTMTEGYASGSAAVVFNYGIIGDISGGEFTVAATAYNSNPSVVTNNGTLNISGGTFVSEAHYAHDVIYTGIYYTTKADGSLDEVIERGETTITGGTFKANTEVTENTYVVRSIHISGRSAIDYTITHISGGTFYGEIPMNSVGLTTAQLYNIAITHGQFDRMVWSDIVNAQWTIRGLEGNYAVIRIGELYSVVDAESLTTTDNASEGYYEAMISSTNAERHVNLYYPSADTALVELFDLGEGYAAPNMSVDLYVTSAQDITLPTSVVLTINYKAEGVKYTGKVTPVEGSSAAVIKEETAEGVTFELGIPREEATVQIERNGAIRYYVDLVDAFNNAQEGDLITVLDDHTLEEVAYISTSNVTLNLNGKAITTTGATNTYVNSGVHNFTICDSEGTGILSAKTYALQISSDVSITIEGGTYTSTASDKNSIYFRSGTGVVCEITGGKFTNYIAGTLPSATAFTISGGSFVVGSKLTLSALESRLAPNCQAVLQEDGTYLVTPKA